MYTTKIKHLIILPLLFIGFLIPDLAFGQFSSARNAVTTLDKVDIAVQAKFDTLKSGTEAQFAVILDIEEGWHLNAHNPTLDYMVGVELEVSASEAAMVSAIQYPKPLKMKFDFAGDKLKVYEGKTAILVKVKTSVELKPGDYHLAATLQVQACSNTVCLPPAGVELSFPITIGNQNIRSDNTQLFQELEDRQVSITASEDNQIALMFNEGGYLWAFFSIFLIGLALNLTPCVYPMMSVTVSLFGGKETDSSTSTASAFTHALIYVMGIVSMYSVLGIIAAYTGALFGSWLQSPWVLAGIGVLIFLLSLSMFGLYELQPPSWLMQKLGKAQQTTGYIGHFLSGLMVGVFAAPCIGPPIIALLAFVGGQGSPVLGFFTFFIMAMGLGIPYLFLGTFSGLLSKMPRSGGWMIWVKKVFGVILVGVALFYLSLAFMPDYSMYTILATTILGGSYLGFIEQSGNHKIIFRRIKRVVGIGALIGGFMLFQNLQKDSVTWEKYNPALITQAKKSGKPVMLDFYADWCIPCIELDRVTFTNNKVIEATSSYVRLKIDLTHFDSRRAEKLRKQYNIVGVPTIVFLNASGNEVEKARVVGFIGPEEFIKRVNKVEKSEKALHK